MIVSDQLINVIVVFYDQKKLDIRPIIYDGHDSTISSERSLQMRLKNHGYY